ncbi:MAG: OmpA family protein, partial [Gammaproteobacteria bacterium]
VSVVDELVVSSDSMLAGWKETAMVALTQLGEFSQGTISIKGDSISMGGIVDSQASSDYVRKSLDAALNGQFTANYAINIENLPVSEPDHSHAVTTAAPATPAAPVVTSEAVIADCQSTFDAALIGQHIRFTTNRAQINAESHALLDSLSAAAKSCPDTHIEIEGHTDSQGSDDYNMMLSQKRAEAVLAYLIDKNVRADRLVAIGYGELQPVADNATASGRASNRRIEFTVKASE